MITEKLTHADFLKLVAGKQGVSTDALVREDCPDRDGYILRVRTEDGKLSERMVGSYIGENTPEGRLLGRSKVFVVPNDTWGCTLYPLKEAV